MFPTAVALVLACLLVLANAFFVASEFAIVKIRPTRLQELAREGSRRARIALAISHRLDAYLSANQLGITLASLGLGWLGEPAFSELIEPLLGALGIHSAATVTAVAVTLAFIIITFLHTVVGELAPKSLAIQRTEPVALWTAAPLRAFYMLAFPIIWFLNTSAALVLRLLHLRPSSDAEQLHTPEELRLLLRRVAMDPSVRRLMDRMFDYTQRVGRHVMTLRRDVVVLEAERSFAENMQLVLDNQYTRYPLVDAEGRVIGYVHMKDIMAALSSGREPTMRQIVREPVWAREDTPLEALRREFQRRRVHMAVVLDKEGTFSGVATLEDLLEEFVGEIQDEQDLGEVPPLVRNPDGRFEAEGRITLDVARRDLGLTLEDAPEEVETLGGYVTSRLGSIPRPGDHIEVDGYRLTVIEVRDRRVRRLRGEPL